MPKTFYSLGYNLPDINDLKMTGIQINGHDYPSENYDEEYFNLTSWWTNSMKTDISAKFEIRITEIARDCALGKDDELFLTLYSYCPGTKLQHHGKPVLIDSNEIDITLTIPENELSDDVNLYAVITTRFNEKNDRKIGAPHKSNSRLLTKSWKIYLSGSRTQGNVVFLDFSKDAAASKALWRIHISENIDMDSWLTAQHSNVLRIEVNEDHKEFIQQPHFQIPLMTDMVMLALGSAIRDDEKLEYLQNDSMPEGSWAKFVKSMFQSVFPTGQLGVKQKWNEEQDRIRTRVQHLMSGNLEIK
jgi:hypothetical protein